MTSLAFLSSVPLSLKSYSLPVLSTRHRPFAPLPNTPLPSCLPVACAQPATQVNLLSKSSMVKTPPQMYEAAVALGAAKSQSPPWKTLLLGIVAGAYIAIGALLALSIGGALPAISAANPGLQKLLFGAFGLPTGLTMVCLTGGELFTGNTALISAAVFDGRAKVKPMLKNWLFSYFGNLIGSLFVVWLAGASCCLSGISGGTAIAIASAKVATSFSTSFFRGVLCNWLVCLAVYMQAGAGDFMGKFFAIWLPISAFVAMGFDHSIANMFLIPMGMKLGAEVTIKQFLLNLLPVTLGNIVGGVVLVGLVYSLAFGKLKLKLK